MNHPGSDTDSALILVIDDEITQRILSRDTLEEAGFRVEDAANGEAGLDLVRKEKPDLVLLDVMMPGMDGFEVCRRIRSDCTVSETPIIIVTGRENTEDIQKGFDAGATDFLTKPVGWKLLPNRVRYVLRTSRLEHDLRLAMISEKKASDAKTALLSTMGHELRTPLNAIIGFSDLMRQEAFGPVGLPQYAEFVEHINESGTRLLNAINDILDIVRCESESLEFDQNEIAIVDLVESVAEHLAPDAAAAEIRIENDVSDAGVSLLADQQRLKQALTYLASNAIKFSEPGGAVRFGMELSQEGRLVLSIVDRGIGISPEDLPRVMEPFQQVDSRLARKYEGLGLGIPVARAIVQQHGGVLTYESTPEEGTTVRVTLPADRVVGSAAVSKRAKIA